MQVLAFWKNIGKISEERTPMSEMGAFIIAVLNASGVQYGARTILRALSQKTVAPIGPPESGHSLPRHIARVLARQLPEGGSPKEAFSFFVRLPRFLPRRFKVSVTNGC